MSRPCLTPALSAIARGRCTRRHNAPVGRGVVFVEDAVRKAVHERRLANARSLGGVRVRRQAAEGGVRAPCCTMSQRSPVRPWRAPARSCSWPCARVEAKLRRRTRRGKAATHRRCTRRGKAATHRRRARLISGRSNVVLGPTASPLGVLLFNFSVHCSLHSSLCFSLCASCQRRRSRCPGQRVCRSLLSPGPPSVRPPPPLLWVYDVRRASTV